MGVAAHPAPDVSVIIAAWSAQGFIAPAIRSALAQDGVRVEVILVDDASPDDTVGAARAAAEGDRRLRIDTLASNGGPARARNRAIDLARGRYIAVLDSDDSLEPGRLEALVRLADTSGADIVADNMNRVETDAAGGHVVSAFLDPHALSEEVQITLADYLDPASAQRFGGELGYLKPLFRADTLARTGLGYDPTLRNSEDYYLVAHLLAAGARMLVSPLRGYNYLVRAGSISYRLTPELTAAILDADRAFEQAYADRLTAAEARALRRRRQQLSQMHALEKVIARLKMRHPHRALGAAMTAPAAMPYIAARLASIGWRKLVA